MKYLFGIICILLCWSHLFSQERQCANVNPNPLSQLDLAFARDAVGFQKATAGVRVVPVAVHVIASSAGSSANISDGQIQSQIDVFNDAFRGVYGGVDTEIEFCLAGVNRVQDPNLSVVYLGVNDLAMRNLSRQNPTEFYNIWVVEDLYDFNGGPAEGFTQYATLLNVDPDRDGTVIFHKFFGNAGTAASGSFPDYEEGKIAVHEAGHWLNLFHVFSDHCDYSWGCGGEGDCCCDTPPQLDIYRKCRKNRNTCRTDQPDEKDPIHNYMGYTPDECRYEFTPCQSGRMNLCLDQIRFDAWFSQGGDCPQLRMLPDKPAPTAPFRMSIFPNPTSSSSTIRISIVAPETKGSLSIYDSTGKLIKEIFDGKTLMQGEHEFRFAFSEQGVFFARFSSSNISQTMKVIRQ